MFGIDIWQGSNGQVASQGVTSRLPRIVTFVGVGIAALGIIATIGLGIRFFTTRDRVSIPEQGMPTVDIAETVESMSETDEPTEIRPTETTAPTFTPWPTSTPTPAPTATTAPESRQWNATAKLRGSSEGARTLLFEVTIKAEGDRSLESSLSLSPQLHYWQGDYHSGSPLAWDGDVGPTPTTLTATFLPDFGAGKTPMTLTVGSEQTVLVPQTGETVTATLRGGR